MRPAWSDSTRVRPPRVSDTALALALALMAALLAYALRKLDIQDRVNAQLGFDYATPQLAWNYEPFLITRVDPGRAMSLAGIREGDRVLFADVSDLYGRLIINQGGVARIPIERGGRSRYALVRVPSLKLPFPQEIRQLLYRPRLPWRALQN